MNESCNKAIKRPVLKVILLRCTRFAALLFAGFIQPAVSFRQAVDQAQQERASISGLTTGMVIAVKSKHTGKCYGAGPQGIVSPYGRSVLTVDAEQWQQRAHFVVRKNGEWSYFASLDPRAGWNVIQRADDGHRNLLRLDNANNDVWEGLKVQGDFSDAYIRSQVNNAPWSVDYDNPAQPDFIKLASAPIGITGIFGSTNFYRPVGGIDKAKVEIIPLASATPPSGLAQIVGRAVSVSLAGLDTKKLWLTNTFGSFFFNNGLTNFVQFPGSGVNIAVTPSRVSLWVCNYDGRLYNCMIDRTNWRDDTEAWNNGYKVRFVAAGGKDAWVVTEDFKISKNNNPDEVGGWVTIASAPPMWQVASAQDGTTCAVGMDGDIYLFNRSKNQFDKLFAGAQAVQVVVADKDGIFFLNKDYLLFRKLFGTSGAKEEHWVSVENVGRPRYVAISSKYEMAMIAGDFVSNLGGGSIYAGALPVDAWRIGDASLSKQLLAKKTDKSIMGQLSNGSIVALRSLADKAARYYRPMLVNDKWCLRADGLSKNDPAAHFLVRKNGDYIILAAVNGPLRGHALQVIDNLVTFGGASVTGDAAIIYQWTLVGKSLDSCSLQAASNQGYLSQGLAKDSQVGAPDWIKAVPGVGGFAVTGSLASDGTWLAENGLREQIAFDIIASPEEVSGFEVLPFKAQKVSHARGKPAITAFAIVGGKVGVVAPDGSAVTVASDLADCAIKPDGKGFGLQLSGQLVKIAADGSISYVVSDNKFSQIAATSSELWGLDAQGQIFRSKSTTEVAFEQIIGTYRAIAAGSDDTVCALGSDGSLYLFNRDASTFDSFYDCKKALSVSVGNRENIVFIDNTYRAWQLKLQKAGDQDADWLELKIGGRPSSISAAPDRSLILIGGDVSSDGQTVYYRGAVGAEKALLEQRAKTGAQQAAQKAEATKKAASAEEEKKARLASMAKFFASESQLALIQPVTADGPAPYLEVIDGKLMATGKTDHSLTSIFTLRRHPDGWLGFECGGRFVGVQKLGEGEPGIAQASRTNFNDPADDPEHFVFEGAKDAANFKHSSGGYLRINPDGRLSVIDLARFDSSGEYILAPKDGNAVFKVTFVSPFFKTIVAAEEKEDVERVSAYVKGSAQARTVEASRNILVNSIKQFLVDKWANPAARKAFESNKTLYDQFDVMISALEADKNYQSNKKALAEIRNLLASSSKSAAEASKVANEKVQARSSALKAIIGVNTYAMLKVSGGENEGKYVIAVPEDKTLAAIGEEAKAPESLFELVKTANGYLALRSRVVKDLLVAIKDSVATFEKVQAGDNEQFELEADKDYLWLRHAATGAYLSIDKESKLVTYDPQELETSGATKPAAKSDRNAFQLAFISPLEFDIVFSDARTPKERLARYKAMQKRAVSMADKDALVAAMADLVSDVQKDDAVWAAAQADKAFVVQLRATVGALAEDKKFASQATAVKKLVDLLSSEEKRQAESIAKQGKVLADRVARATAVVPGDAQLYVIKSIGLDRNLEVTEDNLLHASGTDLLNSKAFFEMVKHAEGWIGLRALGASSRLVQMTALNDSDKPLVARCDRMNFADVADIPEHFDAVGSRENISFIAQGNNAYMTVSAEGDVVFFDVDRFTNEGVTVPAPASKNAQFVLIPVTQFQRDIARARDFADAERLRRYGLLVVSAKTTDMQNMLFSEVEMFLASKRKNFQAWQAFAMNAKNAPQIEALIFALTQEAQPKRALEKVTDRVTSLISLLRGEGADAPQMALEEASRDLSFGERVAAVKAQIAELKKPVKAQKESLMIILSNIVDDRAAATPQQAADLSGILAGLQKTFGAEEPFKTSLEKLVLFVATPVSYAESLRFVQALRNKGLNDDVSKNLFMTRLTQLVANVPTVNAQNRKDINNFVTALVAEAEYAEDLKSLKTRIKKMAADLATQLAAAEEAEEKSLVNKDAPAAESVIALQSLKPVDQTNKFLVANDEGFLMASGQNIAAKGVSLTVKQLKGGLLFVRDGKFLISPALEEENGGKVFFAEVDEDAPEAKWFMEGTKEAASLRSNTNGYMSVRKDGSVTTADLIKMQPAPKGPWEIFKMVPVTEASRQAAVKEAQIAQLNPLPSTMLFADKVKEANAQITAVKKVGAAEKAKIIAMLAAIVEDRFDASPADVTSCVQLLKTIKGSVFASKEDVAFQRQLTQLSKTVVEPLAIEARMENIQALKAGDLTGKDQQQSFIARLKVLVGMSDTIDSASLASLKALVNDLKESSQYVAEQKGMVSVLADISKQLASVSKAAKKKEAAVAIEASAPAQEEAPETPSLSQRIARFSSSAGGLKEKASEADKQALVDAARGLVEEIADASSRDASALKNALTKMKNGPAARKDKTLQATLDELLEEMASGPGFAAVFDELQALYKGDMTQRKNVVAFADKLKLLASQKGTASKENLAAALDLLKAAKEDAKSNATLRRIVLDIDNGIASFTVVEEVKAPASAAPATEVVAPENTASSDTDDGGDIVTKLQEELRADLESGFQEYLDAIGSSIIPADKLVPCARIVHKRIVSLFANAAELKSFVKEESRKDLLTAVINTHVYDPNYQEVADLFKSLASQWDALQNPVKKVTPVASKAGGIIPVSELDAWKPDRKSVV